MERLQKILAQAGVASRRKCEDIIAAGRVTVNDVVVTSPGTKADPEADEIRVDGRLIRTRPKVYLMLNKPKGVITSVHDPQGRKVVTDFVAGIGERVYPVGRLDYDTEGLLLLTNDGEFAHRLMHPRFRIEKTYHATVKGVPHGDDLDKLRNGIELEDGLAQPAEVEYVDINPDKNVSVIAITISEGRNRLVRRMLEAIGFPAFRLKRVRYGNLTLDGLPRGKTRPLSAQEVRELFRLTEEFTQNS